MHKNSENYIGNIPINPNYAEEKDWGPRPGSKESEYRFLCQEASECRNCPNVFHELTYLNENNGNINSPVMFIGEAPGFVRDPKLRLKAFYGNQSGWNFEHLLGRIGLKRDSVFVTNALLHTPIKPSDKKYDDDYGFLQIRPPSLTEIENCGKFLRAQIDLINPRIICTLGRAALNACQSALPRFPHFMLHRHVAGRIKWEDKVIFPLYHTSPNVTSSIRSLKTMEEDFRKLKSLMDELEIKI
jgi:uracil-DNA glycosylase family 4